MVASLAPMLRADSAIKVCCFSTSVFATYQTRESGNREYRHGDNDVRHAAAHHRHHGNRQQNTGKANSTSQIRMMMRSHQHVVPGHQPQHGTNCCAHQHREDPGRQ